MYHVVPIKTYEAQIPFHVVADESHSSADVTFVTAVDRESMISGFDFAPILDYVKGTEM